MAKNRILFSNDFVLKNEKVGINTTDPQALLDVNGELRVTGVSTFTGIVTTTTDVYVGGDLYVQNDGVSTFTNGPVLIGSGSSTGTTTQRLQVTGGAYVSGSVGIGTTNPQYKLHVVGDFGATTKSFVIPHPSKSGMKLRYGSLESPYHGIRLTGSSVIEDGLCVVNLPDYICDLVSEEGININITNIKHGKVLWIEEINIQENKFIVMTEEKVGEYAFYWDFTAIRKDVSNLVTEY